MKTEAQKEQDRESSRKYHIANPEKGRERGRKWRAANREKGREKYKKWRLAHLEVVRVKNQKWRAANPEKALESSRKYRAAHPEQARTTDIKSKYGLSSEDISNMRTKQQNACAICKELFTKTPHIDHDHATGFVRGLLCKKHNHMLGFAEDSEDTLREAIYYLRRSRLAQTAIALKLTNLVN